MMNRNTLITVGSSFLVGAIFAFAANMIFKQKIPASGNQRAACFLQGGQKALFELGGKTYTLDDLPNDMHQSFLLAQIDAFRRMGDVVDEVAARAAVSKNGKIPSMKEIYGEKWVSDADIEAYYKSSTNSFNKQIPLSQVRDAIRSHLEQQKSLAFVAENLPKLKQNDNFKNLIPVPCGPQKSPKTSGVSFVVGETSGKIEIVLFSDFISPQARFAIASVNKFAEINKENVTIREIYIPSDRNGISEELARGAYCVNDQNKKFFGAYRMAAYQSSSLLASKTDPSGQPQARAKTLRDIAKSVGSNEKEFDECMNSKGAKEFIDASIAAAHDAGVSNAPAFFLYNRQIVLPGVSDPGKILTEVFSAIKR